MNAPIKVTGIDCRPPRAYRGDGMPMTQYGRDDRRRAIMPADLHPVTITWNDEAVAGRRWRTVAFIAGLLMLAATVKAGEHRDYPTVLPETVRPSVAPAPGYERVRTTWGAREYRVCTYTNKKLSCVTVCETPGGLAIEDVPHDPPPPVKMLVFLGGDCASDSRSEFYAVHRDSVDSRTFVAARKFAVSQPRVMELYPAHGEVVVMYRSAVLKGAQ